jgi:hypothetical protein
LAQLSGAMPLLLDNSENFLEVDAGHIAGSGNNAYGGSFGRHGLNRVANVGL